MAKKVLLVITSSLTLEQKEALQPICGFDVEFKNFKFLKSTSWYDILSAGEDYDFWAMSSFVFDCLSSPFCFVQNSKILILSNDNFWYKISVEKL